MGCSKKSQVDSGLEPENMRWVIAGIAVRTAIKPVITKPRGREGGVDSDEECSTTPTAKEARIQEILSCPPAPRKQRPPSKWHYNGAKEFFRPPDLETVFKCYAKKAN